MSIQNLVLVCQLVLKKNQILTSIKGRNSVANLRKTKIYKTNVDTSGRTDERKDENYIHLGINAGGIIKHSYIAKFYGLPITTKDDTRERERERERERGRERERESERERERE